MPHLCGPSCALFVIVHTQTFHILFLEIPTAKQQWISNYFVGVIFFCHSLCLSFDDINRKQLGDPKKWMRYWMSNECHTRVMNHIRFLSLCLLFSFVSLLMKAKLINYTYNRWMQKWWCETCAIAQNVWHCSVQLWNGIRCKWRVVPMYVINSRPLKTHIQTCDCCKQFTMRVHLILLPFCHFYSHLVVHFLFVYTVQVKIALN